MSAPDCLSFPTYISHTCKRVVSAFYCFPVANGKRAHRHSSSLVSSLNLDGIIGAPHFLSLFLLVPRPHPPRGCRAQAQRAASLLQSGISHLHLGLLPSGRGWPLHTVHAQGKLGVAQGRGLGNGSTNESAIRRAIIAGSLWRYVRSAEIYH